MSESAAREKAKCYASEPVRPLFDLFVPGHAGLRRKALPRPDALAVQWSHVHAFPSQGFRPSTCTTAPRPS
jgi:hypothetical protein